MNPEQAERILAREWIYSAVERFVEDGWENNPDIGQHSYERISNRMIDLVRTDGTRASVEEAYALLSSLAGEV